MPHHDLVRKLQLTALMQVQTHADTAYYMGVIDGRQRRIAHRHERAVARLIRQRRWKAAHKRREALLQYIQVAMQHIVCGSLVRCSAFFC